MKKKWTITIPNPLALWLLWRRLNKAAKKWNADVERIRCDAATTPDGTFKWSQLVWQEIDMYILLGEQVQPEEFEYLCKRRGFTPAMCVYLKEMMVSVGLGKKLVSADTSRKQPACQQKNMYQGQNA